MMEWIPVFLVTFKAIVLVTGMVFAIKWHYDKGQKEHATDRRAVLRAGGKVAAIFLLSLIGLAIFTIVLVKTVGLNLSLS
jgi:hypothetical protein